MFAPVLPSSRLVRGAAAGTISHQFVDQDGEPAAPAGTVTVTVTRADGTAVTPGAVSGTGTEPRSVTLPAGTLGAVDWLTLTWSDNGIEAATETIEIVGGTFATIAQIRAVDPSLNTKPADDILDKRRIVEDTAVRVLHRSPVERFYVERVSGTGGNALIVSWPDVLEVLWCRVYSSATTYTEFTPAELAAIPAAADGVLRRTDGGVWPCGDSNIEIAYRFGMRALPGDLREALIKTVRLQFAQFSTGVPSNASSMTTADGVTVQFVSPDNERWTTGDVTIDRVVNGYRFRTVGIA